eukprot:TRINITY_DN23251_c0_g5_i1.p2 TRINITY_DN23251_c0_g5~~TRINITY_DN23251_c0_g5_i1.p2  ORF type:complete len:448 (+),score=155.41 TRINITY_DN23251_c0_g5_i1:111-1454(+)
MASSLILKALFAAAFAHACSGAPTSAAPPVTIDREASLWPSFQTLPKNQYGRLEATEGAEVLHRYFAREHGLQVKAEVLSQAAANALAGAGGRGLSMNALVGAAERLEERVLRTRQEDMRRAFGDHTFSWREMISHAALHGVLTSYLQDLAIEVGDLNPSELFDAYRFKLEQGWGSFPPRFGFADALEIASYVLPIVQHKRTCDALLNELEQGVQAPTTSPERLLNVAARIAQRRSMPVPSVLPPPLAAVAARNGGSVPLYGQSLNEVLYWTFPSDCPAPPGVEVETHQEVELSAAGAFVAQLLGEDLGLLLSSLEGSLRGALAGASSASAAPPAAPSAAPAARSPKQPASFDLGRLASLTFDDLDKALGDFENWLATWSTEDLMRVTALALICTAMLRMIGGMWTSSRGAVRGAASDIKKDEKAKGAEAKAKEEPKDAAATAKAAQ